MRPVRRRALLGAQSPREIARFVAAERPVELDLDEPSHRGAAAPSGVHSISPIAHTLRPLNAPTPLRVQLDQNGRVVALWRNGRLTPRRIAAIQDRWRIDDEWWREHAVSRMYYALLLDDGTLLTVYHDVLTDQWFEQRG